MNSNRDVATSSMDGAGTVLALDGGNSKTDAAVVTAGGALLARVRGPGFRPHLGRETALAGLQEVATSALAQAGLSKVSLLSACLANSDLPQEDAEYGEWFQAKGFADQVAVTNDVFALLRSGTRARSAVTVVCGAGMNCVGVAPGREPVRFLALGTFTGDWGGGGTLSDEAMFWAMRAEDGRSGPTALARAIPDHFALSCTHQVAEALHLGAIDRHRTHELVPLLFRVATAGDAVALSVVHRQADEIIAFAMAALRRLDLLDTETEVVLGGGVLAAKEPVLLEPILTALAERAPNARVTIPQIQPIVGAVLLGLEHLTPGGAVSVELEKTIRTAFGELMPTSAALQT